MQLEKKVLVKALSTLSGKHSDVANAIDRTPEFAEELEELLSDLEEGA